jgi:hypothetical protein
MLVCYLVCLEDVNYGVKSFTMYVCMYVCMYDTRDVDGVLEI